MISPLQHAHSKHLHTEICMCVCVFQRAKKVARIRHDAWILHNNHNNQNQSKLIQQQRSTVDGRRFTTSDTIESGANKQQPTTKMSEMLLRIIWTKTHKK